MRIRVAWTAAVVVVLAAMATGCDDVSGPSPTYGDGSVVDDAAPQVIAASAYRSRDDDARGGRFQITVANTSTGRITLQTVQFRSPGFAQTAASDRVLEMGPGARIDVPVTFGAADCGRPSAPIEAVIGYLDATGAAAEVTVPLAQPYDIIDRIHDEECAAQRLAERLDMTFTVADAVEPNPTGGLPLRAAALTIGRVEGAPDVPVRIDEVAGSVVWSVLPDPSDPLPLTLPTAEPSLTAPLMIGPATCADHVLADSKQPFVFPVWIAVGEDTPQYARIPVDEATRQDLSSFLGNVCAGS